MEAPSPFGGGKRVLGRGRRFRVARRSTRTGEEDLAGSDTKRCRGIRETAAAEPSRWHLRKEEKKAPTFEEFEEQFLTYSRTHNRASAVYAKESMLKVHLRPFFAKFRLDGIRVPDIEKFKAQKLAEGYSPKSINNFLCALRKLLNLAVEWGALGHAPKVKQLQGATLRHRVSLLR